MMTEYWVDFAWSNCAGGFCSPYIRTYSGRDGGAWHRELSGGGWYPVSSDHYLYICAGGLGYTAVQLCGHQGIGYKGQFDQPGTDYCNAFWNSIYGKASGGWTCYISWNIRKTFSGWHRDNWCDSGRR
jgi:hypothetical protein